VTWFLAGSSSFSWYDLAGLGDNHLATLPTAQLAMFVCAERV